MYQQAFEEAINEVPYVIPMKSDLRFVWDMLIIIFALLNSYFLPLSIAFREFTDSIEVLVILDDINVYVFLLDLMLGFNTTYINVATGEEVWGRRFIATNYVFYGTFIIDLLSTF